MNVYSIKSRTSVPRPRASSRTRTTRIARTTRTSARRRQTRTSNKHSQCSTSSHDYLHQSPQAWPQHSTSSTVPDSNRTWKFIYTGPSRTEPLIMTQVTNVLVYSYEMRLNVNIEVLTSARPIISHLSTYCEIQFVICKYHMQFRVMRLKEALLI